MEKRTCQDGVMFTCYNDVVVDIDAASGVEYVEIYFNIYMPESKKSFPDVQELIIDANVSDIEIPNTLFPNVTLVTSKSFHFYDNESYLIKNEKGFRKLLNVFCGPDMEFDLTNINRIADYAFAESNISKFKDVKKILFSCDSHAFTNSVFDKQPFMNGVKMAGDILIAVDETVNTIELHDEENPLYMCVDGIHLSAVKHMVIHNYISILNYRINEVPQSITLDAKVLDDRAIEQVMHTIKPQTNSYVHTLHLSNNVSAYKEIDGMIYTADMSSLVGCSINKEDALLIPEGVKSIASYAFANTHVRNIKLPNSLETLEDYAFCKCSELTDIEFGNGLSCISRYAFLRCSKLEHIKLPAQMRIIGSFAFNHSGLKSIELNEGLKIIHYNALDATNISELALPSSLELLEPLGKSQNITHISIGKYIKELASSIAKQGKLTSNEAYNDSVVELKCDDKTLFIPSFVRNNGYYDMCQRIKVFFLDDSGNETMSLYPYAATIAGRENTAMLEYGQFHGDSQKEYLKRHAKSIILRLIREKDEERAVQFLRWKLIPQKDIKELLKKTNSSELSIVTSYLLEEMNGKTQSEDFNL